MSIFSGLDTHLENSSKNAAAVSSSIARASVDNVAIPSITLLRVPSAPITAFGTVLGRD